MSTVQLTIKKRFTIIVIILGITIFALFVTSINQFQKIKQLTKLKELSGQLAESKHSIDSLQNIMFSILPYDIKFFKTNQAKIVDELKKVNQQYIVLSRQISGSYYLAGNKKIKLKVNEILSEYRKYNESLDKYLLLLKEKGYDKYGLNGQIDLLTQNILKSSMELGLQNVAQKIKLISDYKNEYLLLRDLALINKIIIEIDEARTYALLAAKVERLALLSKLQKLENNIKSLSEFDEAIGLTTYDGLAGSLKQAKDKISINSLELKNLVEHQTKIALNHAYIWIGLLLLLILAILFIIYEWLEKYVFKPLHSFNNFVLEIAKGKLPDPIKFQHTDEITNIATHLNEIVEGLKSKAAFAIEIGKGKLGSYYEPLSEADILGNALIEMEKSLQKADNEDHKYKNEEKKRIWSNEGLARFAEILRMHNNDINKLADEIIQNIVKYLNASQGALYFLNDDDKENICLDLVSAYAFDRKKHIKQTVKPGEGLIGAVALEREKIFVTDIPEDYLTINSGLGDAPPRSILIIPLKLETELLGVVEIASFSIFEKHEIEFVEKIAETIASTITSVKINARTSKLLEQSQKQAEEMAEQEEEMRQNMEELRTTQEEFARRESEMQGLVDAVHQSAMVMILDENGKVIEANENLLNKLLSKEDDIIGRNHKDLISQAITNEEYENFWDKLKTGHSSNSIEKVRLSNGKDVYLKQYFTPILDRKNNLHKVLCVSIDITEAKTNEILYKSKSDDFDKLKTHFEQLNLALDTSLVRCEYNGDGRIADVNELFCKVTGHSRNELIGKVNTIYLKDEEKQQFEKVWNEVIKDKSYTGSLKRSKPTGEDVWLMASFIPVSTDEGIVTKVYMVAQDITERRLKYQLLEEANKEIDRLKKNKDKDKE